MQARKLRDFGIIGDGLKVRCRMVPAVSGDTGFDETGHSGAPGERLIGFIGRALSVLALSAPVGVGQDENCHYAGALSLRSFDGGAKDQDCAG